MLFLFHVYLPKGHGRGSVYIYLVDHNSLFPQTSLFSCSDNSVSACDIMFGGYLKALFWARRFTLLNFLFFSINSITKSQPHLHY